MRPLGMARVFAGSVLVAGGLLFGSQACGEAFQAGPEEGAGAAAGAATTSTGTTSAGGGGSSTGGDSAGGGGTSSGVGGDPTGENCYNGQDDDGDNLVDCADEECAAQGFTCRALGTWEEPVVLLGAASVDQCPSGWQQDVLWQAGTAIDAAEPGCACPACDASAVECNAAPGLALYSALACGGSPTQVGGNALDACFSVTTPAGAQTFRASQVSPSGDCIQPPAEKGDCEVTNPHQKCTRSALVTGGCDGEQVCVPPPAAQLPVCVYAVGDVPCSVGLETDNRTVLYVLDDTRQCNCSCQSRCQVSATLYCDATCTSPDKAVVTGTECGPVPDCGASRSAEESATPQCLSMLGQTGACTDAANPLTFCCWTD